MKLIKALVAPLLWPAFGGGVIFAMEILQRVDPARVSWIPLMVFALGISAWFLIHLLFPRPAWLYVFGHEATHALAVLLSGGRVEGFHVSGRGGHVVADRLSAFIALSPYVVPFYPLVLGVGWAVVLAVWPGTEAWTIVFLPLWGMSWGFHLAFTASLLKTAQQDFESQGYLFSWTVILLANGWIFLIVAAFWLRPCGVVEGVVLAGEALGRSYVGAWNALRSVISLLS